MAAVLVMPTTREWKIIKPFLDKLQDGAIVVSPEISKELTQKALEKTGIKLNPGDIIEYEFGGDPDICVDVVESLDHLAVDLLTGEDDEEN